MKYPCAVAFDPSCCVPYTYPCAKNFPSRLIASPRMLKRLSLTESPPDTVPSCWKCFRKTRLLTPSIQTVSSGPNATAPPFAPTSGGKELIHVNFPSSTRATKTLLAVSLALVTEEASSEGGI